MERILQVAVLATLTCVVFGQGDICVSPSGVDGKCVPLDDCEKLKNLIRGSSSDREILKQWHCGFQGITPYVCCPVKTTTTTTSTTTGRPPQPENKCVTLEGTLGTCVDLAACPKVAKRLKDPTEENLEYVQRSRCIGTVQYSVCCDIDASQVVTKKPGGDTSLDRYSNHNADCPPTPGIPDPNGGCCGKDSTSGNRIIYGVPTSVDQYPWLAMIEYTRDYLCGGTLISNQHVLTAAHCIVTPMNKTRGAKSVRLGEYNTTNTGPDCVEVEGGGQDCTLGAISIPIASIEVHPDYNTDKVVIQANDIALIKLSQMVAYTDFVRPICLPTLDITKAPPPDLRFFVAGWGAVDERHSTSDIKLHADLPYVDEMLCRNLYSRNGAPLIWNKQICAGGEFNVDSCKGDSGGPLMYFDGKKFELSGVISFGVIQCGNKDKPSIYTNVHEYVPWIKSIA